VPSATENHCAEARRLRAVVRGRVQGVSFRFYTQAQAEALGLVGYVRNHWDGTVEVVAEGTADQLQRLLAWLRVGPSLAHVSQVEATWQAPRNEFDHFEVRY